METDSKKIIVTGGGTGGHLRIAKSFMDALKQKNIDIIYIGSSNGYDKQWFQKDINIDKAIFYDTKGVVNKNLFGKILSMIKIFKSAFNVIQIIREYEIKAVISVGGYSAAAASFGAIATKTPLFIHEQNAHIGKLNKLFKPYAKVFYSSYDEGSPIQDYPVDKKFFDLARVREDIKTIIFLGGSQGATFINNFAMKVAKYLNDNGIEIIHQTGENDYEVVSNFYKTHNIKADVFAFDKFIEEKFNRADIAISRSGASTMWELVANSLPTIFIPYPYASSDHQYKNAKFLEDNHLCFLFREEEFRDDKDYISVLEEFMLKDIKTISEKLDQKISHNGLELLIEDILNKI